MKRRPLPRLPLPKLPLPRLLCPLLLTAGLLAACTGTEEGSSTTRLALLTDGGNTLRAVTVVSGGGTPITDAASTTVTGGVSLDTLPSGVRLALTLTGGIESRGVTLTDPQAFAAPPLTGVCLNQTAASAARDRLLTFSECASGPQELALYRADGTLVWTATLPTFLPPAASTDTPPIRLAVQGDVAVVARPTVGGGSEVIRVAQQYTGDAIAAYSAPVNTVAIRDLAPYGPDLLAATDSGIQKLAATGVPDGSATLTAFGTNRYDRLWTGSSGSRNLLAAWRSNVLNQTAYQPLLLWDGLKANAVAVATFSDLRDVTLALDGSLNALTATTLSTYNTVLGLAQGTFQARTLLDGLSDARSVTWLVP